MRQEWPEGKHIAVMFDVMFEAWGVGKGPAAGPMGNPINHSTQSGLSWPESSVATTAQR